mmetsp:Transcript_35660/g.68862  ORF Transcript_35660/g.68862 Transcript_35660/m.68862 type:complete len:239 (+) Transcript_35660:2604-3320(+)
MVVVLDFFAVSRWLVHGDLAARLLVDAVVALREVPVGNQVGVPFIGNDGRSIKGLGTHTVHRGANSLEPVLLALSDHRFRLARQGEIVVDPLEEVCGGLDRVLREQDQLRSGLHGGLQGNDDLLLLNVNSLDFLEVFEGLHMSREVRATILDIPEWREGVVALDCQVDEILRVHLHSGHGLLGLVSQRHGLRHHHALVANIEVEVKVQRPDPQRREIGSVLSPLALRFHVGRDRSRMD